MRCDGTTCWRTVPFNRSKSEVEICLNGINSATPKTTPLVNDIVLLLVRMLGLSEAVEIIQLGIVCQDVGDDLFIGGLSLITGLVNPTLHGGWMDTLNASHRLGAQALNLLTDRAFDFLFRGFQVVESRAVTIAKSPLMEIA